MNPAAKAGFDALIDAGAKKWLKTPEEKTSLAKQSGQIAGRIAADMKPLFDYESSGVAKNDKEAVLCAIADTLSRTALTSELLIGLNLDAQKLSEHLLAAYPEVVRDLGGMRSRCTSKGLPLSVSAC